MRIVCSWGLLAAMWVMLQAVIAQGYWCDMEDEFAARVQENSLLIIHQAASYNCCQDHFAYTVQQEGDTLIVQENEVPPGGLCDCLCCFNLSVRIDDLTAGTYLLDFQWYNYETAEWQQWLQEVTVPGQDCATRTDDPIIVFGECLGSPTDVPYLERLEHDERIPATWGTLKARFR